MSSDSAPATVPPVPSFPIDLGSIRSMIEYRFTLIDSYVDINGLPTFIVANEKIKMKFQELLRDLANHNLVAKIRRVSDKLVISVYSKPRLGQPRKRINLLLFLASVATVGYASYLVIFPIDPRFAFMYTYVGATDQMLALAAGILSIIGLHELGHVAAVRHHKMDSTLPYFVPGPPPFGTFGAVISLRAPPANRDQLFDLGFSGPITGFAVMVLVAVVAILVSPTIPTQEAAQLFAAKLLQSGAWPSQPYLLDLVGSIRTVPAGQVIVWSQFIFAAYIGSLVTFLNLLPVWQLDGGHIIRATLGEKWHKVTPLIAFGLLAVAGYWAFALLLVIFMVASRRPLQGLEPLDDISPLSNSRRLLFAIALVMLALTFVIL